jgi:Leucine-rich repeat (LRR) protein/DNA-directed RNA polymerase subunit RPC12/RpoP
MISGVEVLKITDLKCPSCGGKLEPMKNNPKIVVCEYCSSQFMLEEDQTINYHIHQYPGTAPQAGAGIRRDDSWKTAVAVLAICAAVFLAVGIFAGQMEKNGGSNAKRTQFQAAGYETAGKMESQDAMDQDPSAMSPLCVAMVEAMFGISADQIKKEDLQQVTYLKLTQGQGTCALEYSFEDPYGEEPFAPVAASLPSQQWDSGDLALFSGLIKLDLSQMGAYSSIKEMEKLRGLACTGLDLSQIKELLASPGQLTELSAKGLESLEGMGEFENLEILRLEDMENPDLKQLTPLKKLRILTIKEQEPTAFGSQEPKTLTDYSPLSVLTALEQLEVASPLMRDFRFLDSLENLTSLSLEDTEAISLEPVGELEGLTSLSLVDNGSIKDYGPIGRLRGLTDLTLDKSTSQDDPDLSALTALTDLDISGFLSVSFLKNMGNLRHLSIHGCNVDEIGALSGLTGLESLACYSVWTYGVPLRDLAFVDRMPNLKVLDLSGISQGGVWGGYQRNTEVLGDISNVFNHQGLEELYLNNCMFEIDFDRLVENPSLRILEMREVDLKENFYVKTQGGMTDLWYDDVALDNYTRFLAKYPGLGQLYLDGNQLTNIQFASDLKNLTHLGIRNNYVTDLSPLDQAENLKVLDIRENPISGTVESDGKVEILR